MCQRGPLIYWDSKEHGVRVASYPLDQCISLEVLDLLEAGIKTWSSCCGHYGESDPFVLTAGDPRPLRDLGYDPEPWMPDCLTDKWRVTPLTAEMVLPSFGDRLRNVRWRAA